MGDLDRLDYIEAQLGELEIPDVEWLIAELRTARDRVQRDSGWINDAVIACGKRRCSTLIRDRDEAEAEVKRLTGLLSEMEQTPGEVEAARVPGEMTVGTGGVAKVAPTMAVTDAMVAAACDAWAVWHTEGGWAPMNGSKPMLAALVAALLKGDAP